MNRVNRAARKRAESRGRRGEALAALWLRLKGYRVLARHVRTAVGEIDLVARRGRVVAFVEVKVRADRAQASQAILAQQRRRIHRAAQMFLQRHPQLASCDQRFDAVLITPFRPPCHIMDAWRDADSRDMR